MLRRPIILHHGLFGFDKIQVKDFRLNYWGNIPELLVKLGYRVYISKVGKTHSIEQRSKSLHEFIKKNDIKDAHIIAHSLGGLDARYLLHKYKTQPDAINIKTLTTLGTPHLGSDFMDLLNKRFGLGYRYSSIKGIPKPTSILYQLFYYLDQPAYSCLTSNYSTYFNKMVSVNLDTDYYSIGAAFKCKNTFLEHLAKELVANDLKSIPILQILKLRKLDELIGLLERILFILTNEENDGLVTLTSSHFGHSLSTLQGSHWDLVDFSGRFGHAMEPHVEEMYVKIIQHLRKYDE